MILESVGVDKKCITRATEVSADFGEHTGVAQWAIEIGERDQTGTGPL